MSTKFKYLHTLGPSIYHLDHRVRPEVRAMFCAMVSRIPVGGIRKRYSDVLRSLVHADVRKIYVEPAWERLFVEHERNPICVRKAEEKLTELGPLPASVQEFFDIHVGKYGHSSILELSGDPAIFVEDVSWYAAWLAFDTPLCEVQEMSTRAVRRRDWPVCREIENLADEPENADLYEAIIANHQEWMVLFGNEVDWWKTFFQSADNRQAYGIEDDEPFRPALDRARWALPGSYATSLVATSHLRDRARAIHQAAAVAASANTAAASKLWQEVYAAHDKALPGFAGLGLKSAVYEQRGLPPIPQHLRDHVGLPLQAGTRVHLANGGVDLVSLRPHPRTAGQYADPILNRQQVYTSFYCSLAIARDWHRHRTFMPWQLRVLPGTLHGAYTWETRSNEEMHDLLEQTAQLHASVRDRLGEYMAMLVLPFGTPCNMQGQAGLQHWLYTMELRSKAKGTNFEYREQARQALQALRGQLEASPWYNQVRHGIFPNNKE